MLTIDQQALRWVARHKERPLAAPEQALFDAWFALDARHRGAYLRAQAIENVLAKAGRQPALIPIAQPYAAAENEAAHRNTARRTWLRLGALTAGVAAIGLAAIVATRPEQAVWTTAKGEQRTVSLPDRSLAHINSGSRIEVTIGRKERRVTLQRGEAWFQVARDGSRPFIVEAGGARVQAVGTAFSVRRHADGAEVLVTEGVVDISAISTARSAARRRLLAGDRAVIRQAGGAMAVSREPGEIARRLAWREGRLRFNHPLGDAVADFNRYSKKQIVILDPALRSKVLVGQYQIASPETFARAVGVFFNVPIAVTADRILIGAPR